MNFPEELKYTKEHEWVRVEGSTAVVGITEHAQSELGDVVYVDVPDASATIAAGDSVGTIEAVKTVADIYSPVSGTITEVNAVNDGPDIVNREPYGNGWLLKITMSNPAEVDGLMSASEYKALIGL